MWQKDVAEYCKTCDRCQKANKSTDKRLRNMIKIKEPSRPWEIIHMDWVTGLPPGGDRSYNACLLIVVRLNFDRFTNEWCTLLAALELAYKTSIHSSTNQTPAILEKGWNPKLPQNCLRIDLIEIHPTAASCKGILDKARKHAVRCMEDSFAYAKDICDKSHATPDFKVGDLALVSTTNFNNIKGCKKLKDSFAGPFVIKALDGENGVEVELSEELSNTHPTF
ncbi:hypothetical protein O181_104950 [Austropuccinia psidii MF-1]|uniref:Integrase zinc-binding domain-containing protein n=1 Tax=Austropuccinia psidii MF-1 TaxID=1389203 RepID=A0A9Q3PL76_9BASI|nr:hypothetical protein [Austropuccinia psidii MF-1]